MELAPIIASIKRGECLLVLGPELAPAPGELPLLQAFAQQKPGLHAPQNLIYTADGLLTFADSKGENQFGKDWRDFCDQQPIAALHQQIAQIPFPIVFSLTTDNLAERAYEQEYKQRANFLSIGTRKVDADKLNLPQPTGENPLIVSLFANVGKSHPYMVMTHLKMIDFLFNVLTNGKERVLPELVRETQVAATQVLFVGCRWETWYMKIFLQLFGLGRDAHGPIAWEQRPIAQAEQGFLESTFALTFVEQEPHTLIEALWKAFNEQPLQEKHPVQIAVDAALTRGELREALKALAAHFGADAGATNDIILLRGRLSTLQEDIADGVISAENAGLERNKIARAIQDLSQRITQP